MSVIVQDEDGQMILLCKGADRSDLQYLFDCFFFLGRPMS